MIRWRTYFGILLDELHGLCVHGEGRFGLLGVFLQGVSTLDERHHGVQVVHRLLKPVHLWKGRHASKLTLHTTTRLSSFPHYVMRRVRMRRCAVIDYCLYGQLSCLHYFRNMLSQRWGVQFWCLHQIKLTKVIVYIEGILNTSKASTLTHWIPPVSVKKFICKALKPYWLMF